MLFCVAADVADDGAGTFSCADLSTCEYVSAYAYIVLVVNSVFVSLHQQRNVYSYVCMLHMLKCNKVFVVEQIVKGVICTIFLK